VIREVSGLLWMLPALVLAALLLVRRYPGERALIARWTKRPRRARLRAAAPSRVREGLLAGAVRGALLMARSLAVRPPPRLLTAR
jgi:hypothetical protein